QRGKARWANPARRLAKNGSPPLSRRQSPKTRPAQSVLGTTVAARLHKTGRYDWQKAGFLENWRDCKFNAPGSKEISRRETAFVKSGGICTGFHNYFARFCGTVFHSQFLSHTETFHTEALSPYARKTHYP